MAEPQIKFEDGASYERMMGVWSRLAGEVFLDWLKLPSGLRWIDVGCGNGAFTELLIERGAPTEVQGLDPSEGQLTFARQRHKAGIAKFQQGDAMALPFGENQFDAATMALVIFFVPDPVKGAAEMKRVVRPGGTIAAYAWDMLGGGFPWDPVQVEMRALGQKTPLPPSASVSRMESLRELWTAAGLESVETREITVERSFPDFEAFWGIVMSAPSIGPAVAAMPPADVELLKSRVRAKLQPDSAGPITYSARANSAKGRMPD